MKVVEGSPRKKEIKKNKVPAALVTLFVLTRLTGNRLFFFVLPQVRC